MSKPHSSKDYPPGLQGGLENDAEDHRVGESGQTGPEAPGDVNRSHSTQRGQLPPDAPKQPPK